MVDNGRRGMRRQIDSSPLKHEENCSLPKTVRFSLFFMVQTDLPQTRVFHGQHFVPACYRSLRIIRESIGSYPLLCARVDRAKLCSSFITMARKTRGGKALYGVVAPVSLSGDKLVYSVCSLLVLFWSWPIRWVSQTTATISICLAFTRHFKTICHFDWDMWRVKGKGGEGKWQHKVCIAQQGGHELCSMCGAWVWRQTRTSTHTHICLAPHGLPAPSGWASLNEFQS